MNKVFFTWLSAICLALGASSIAFAGGPPADKGSPAGPVELYNAFDAEAAEFHERFGNDDTCSRNLDAPILVFPVTRYEQLTAYMFTVPRVCLKRGNQYDYISNIHFITDAITRAAHRAPMLMNDDGTLDKSATSEAVLEALSEFINPDNIDRIDLIERDLRLLR